MEINNSDLQQNYMVKKLGELLPLIDNKISWVDYIPDKAVRTKTPLVAIGMKDGSVKYVDVKKKDPFKFVNEVLNAMDDYCLDVMYLTSSQVGRIKDDVAFLAKSRMALADEISEHLNSGLFTNEVCTKIVREAAEYGVFPRFFPNSVDTTVDSSVLLNFLHSSKATVVDTNVLSNIVTKEVVRLREQAKETAKKVVVMPRPKRSISDAFHADSFAELEYDIEYS